MNQEYVFHEPPSAVWAVEYTNVHGDRVVDVLGTEFAARRTAERYAVADAVLLRASTDFESVPQQGATRKTGALRRYRARFAAHRGNLVRADSA